MKEINDMTVEELREALIATRGAQAGSDKMVSKLQAEIADMKREKESNPDPTDLRDRLQRAIEGFHEKERKLEIDFYAKTKCLEHGIDFDLISDSVFDSETAVDEKILKMQGFVERVSLDAIQKKLLSNEPPKSGVSDTSRRPSPYDELVRRAMPR